MNRFSFVDCTSVNDALDQMNHGATVKAGGIDLLDLMKDGIVAPSTLVNIRQIKGLHGIAVSEQGLTIGPLTTLAELAAHPDIQQKYTALSDAAISSSVPPRCPVRRSRERQPPSALVPKHDGPHISVAQAASFVSATFPSI